VPIVVSLGQCLGAIAEQTTPPRFHIETSTVKKNARPWAGHGALCCTDPAKSGAKRRRLPNVGAEPRGSATPYHETNKPRRLQRMLGGITPQDCDRQAITGMKTAL